MRVVFTLEADEQADAMDVWWRSNRPDARDLFANELAQAVTLLAEFPSLGSKYRTRSGRELQRLLLPRTKNHIYFEVWSKEELVVIHSVWGAPRGREPVL